MEYRISELMSGYELSDAPMEDGGALNMERVKRMAMKRCVPEVKKVSRSQAGKKRRGRVGVRTLLIAAAVVVLLAAAAFAVYNHSYDDFVVESYPAEEDMRGEAIRGVSTVGAAPGEESDEADGENDGSIASGAEFLAMEEWTEIYFAHQSFEDFEGEEPLADDDWAKLYSVGWPSLKAQLEAVAEKYGLRLLQSATEYNGSLDEALAALGIDNLTPWTAATENVNSLPQAVVYDEGSFMIQEYVPMPEGVSNGEHEYLFYRLHRVMKGTLYTMSETGGDSADYQTQRYETVGGVQVDLMLGTRASFIAAELDDCYVTVCVSGGYDPGEYIPYLDMDDLQQLADAFDFAQLG